MIKKFVSAGLFIFFAVVVAVLVAGLVFYDRQNQTAKPPIVNQPISDSVDPALTAQEIAKHASVTDCWGLLMGLFIMLLLPLPVTLAELKPLLPLVAQTPPRLLAPKEIKTCRTPKAPRK
ncbi:MAG TPA: hypothetical protein P5267_00845 [Patescibacteria group bacterium]|nr:hypothetical protein [Patescibacteria group bacterium]